jgi:hypothetical protein
VQVRRLQLAGMARRTRMHAAPCLALLAAGRFRSGWAWHASVHHPTHPHTPIRLHQQLRPE